jgi:hypothetical protein
MNFKYIYLCVCVCVCVIENCIVNVKLCFIFFWHVHLKEFNWFNYLKFWGIKLRLVLSLNEIIDGEQQIRGGISTNRGSMD